MSDPGFPRRGGTGGGGGVSLTYILPKFPGNLKKFTKIRPVGNLLNLNDFFKNKIAKIGLSRGSSMHSVDIWNSYCMTLQAECSLPTNR